MRRGNWMRGQLSQILSCVCFSLLLLLLVKAGDAADVSSDSIVLGASLTGSQTRISQNGVFKLGFFNLTNNITNNNVKKWYVGIWYATASQQTIAWVANREQPLQNASGVFNLTEDGRLLLSYGGSTIWSSNGNGKKPSSAVIMDSGNLVVVSAQNTSENIWESFDHPGNTWLPGMKISVNQSVIAWKSTWDPTPGPYGLQMAEDGTDQFVLVWKNKINYWQSGAWNGQIFSDVPEMTQNYIYNFSFVSKGSSKYFTYSVKSEFTYLSRFVLDQSGEIRVYIMLSSNQWSMFWAQPRDQCQVYDLCGAYGSCNNNNLQSCSCLTGFVANDTQEWDSQQWSSGCVRKTPLKCSNAGNWTNKVGFVELGGKSMPPQWVQYEGQGQEQCRTTCLGNCSCTAYAYISNSTLQACLIWFGELLDLSDTASNGISLFLLLDDSDLPNSSGSNKKATLAGVVGGVAGGLVVIMALVFLFLCCCRRTGLSATEYAPGTLTVFTYRELQVATKNFSERLGGGGFGSVFKGALPDGSLVAVKKLEGVSQGEKQFRMEVSTIGTTQHVNLVRLRGFCTEGSGRLLVYEYMPNGCLSDFLFHKKRNNDEQKVLDWKTRFAIAVGTARGIAYLHEKCRDCIIHCDIKPENILLDSNFCPKVADFGLAKLLGREYSKVLTTMRGTRGYLLLYSFCPCELLSLFLVNFVISTFYAPSRSPNLRFSLTNFRFKGFYQSFPPLFAGHFKFSGRNSTCLLSARSFKPLVRSTRMPQIQYSEKYTDDTYEYRHVVLPPETAKLLPKNRLLNENEWRAIGVQQSRGWVHYAIHRPEPHIMLFRRPLNYQQNQQQQAGAQSQPMGLKAQ